MMLCWAQRQITQLTLIDAMIKPSHNGMMLMSTKATMTAIRPDGSGPITAPQGMMRIFSGDLTLSSVKIGDVVGSR